MIPTISSPFVAHRIAALLDRPATAYKNQYGKILVMAGSPGMAGAAVLCGTACLRTGSGLVQYCVPEIIRDVLQIAVPEATCLPRERDTLNTPYDVIAVGPGLGDHKTDRPLLEHLLHRYRGILVLDADGLNDLTRFHLESAACHCPAHLIMTPHEGEAARLLGTERLQNRDEAVRALAGQYHATVVLKGHETLICSPDGLMRANRETGNPGMATGGSGDVLTGMIASLAGQGLTAPDAAACGVYLHGAAGDLCMKQFGQAGMLAGDLCRAIPLAMKKIKEKNE